MGGGIGLVGGGVGLVGGGVGLVGGGVDLVGGWVGRGVGDCAVTQRIWLMLGHAD